MILYTCSAGLGNTLFHVCHNRKLIINYTSPPRPAQHMYCITVMPLVCNMYVYLNLELTNKIIARIHRFRYWHMINHKQRNLLFSHWSISNSKMNKKYVTLELCSLPITESSLLNLEQAASCSLSSVE